MKRFIIIGAILASVTVFVLLAHQEVFAGPKKRWIKIRIDFDTGEVIVNKNEVKGHDSGSNDRELTPAQLQTLLQGPHTYIGKLVFTHSSPGCVTYILGGDAVTMCY